MTRLMPSTATTVLLELVGRESDEPAHLAQVVLEICVLDHFRDPKATRGMNGNTSQEMITIERKVSHAQQRMPSQDVHDFDLRDRLSHEDIKVLVEDLHVHTKAHSSKASEPSQHTFIASSANPPSLASVSSSREGEVGVSMESAQCLRS